MPVPWLRLIDGVLGATDLVRWVKGRSTVGEPGTLRHLETRLAGVVVAALKEAFARDHERLDIERQRIEDERRRAEVAMRLELLRQAGDREIGRLRLLAGVATVSLLGTLLLITRMAGASLSARVALGLGWVMLIAALGVAFRGQSRVARSLGRADELARVDEVTSPGAGAWAPWLIVAGLATIVLGVLLV